MILGTILVLVTWIVVIGVISIVGIAVSLWQQGHLNKPALTLGVIRRGFWWGFAICVIVILSVGLWTPLSSILAALIFLVLLSAAAITIYVQRPKVNIHLNRPQLLQWAVLAGVTIPILYLAFAALGPVTNYDSGLYHLGAIKYASEYSTISGLANLYFPFGYNTSQYPLAAFLSNGPWGAEGYRLLNGLIVSLFAMDLALRLLANRGGLKKLSAGTWVLMISAPVILIPLVALADYWVTSPSSDAPVMILTFVALAYLVDGISQAKNRIPNLAVAFVISVILFSLRPTSAFFLIGITAVILLALIRLRHRLSTKRSLLPLLIAGGVGLIVLLVQTIRDYFLSGWFQFPLSIYSFTTPWTAADPVWNRTATLGNARNPADIWGSVDGFNWVPAWVGRLPSQWESYLILVLALGLVLTIVIALYSRVAIPWRLTAIVLFPSLVSTLAWFFISPPAFRFGWGSVFSLFVIPLGLLLQRLTKETQPMALSRSFPRAILTLSIVGMLVVTAFSATMRLPKLLDPEPASFSLGPITLEYKATPVRFMPVTLKTLPSGLAISQPTESDQCWDNYPLCTPIVSDGVRLRGDAIQEGFLP
jgi:hypothetical protein